MPAHSVLIERDLLTTGDGLLTYDTDSGLEWLDLTATTGLSYLDIQADTGGWLSQGFSMASIADVTGLFESVGLTYTYDSTPSSLTSTELAMITDLMSLVGETAPDMSTRDHNTYGRVTDGYVNNGFQANYTAGLIYSNGGTVAITGTLGASLDSFSSPDLGNWLYRVTSVPEPSTLTLFALSLIGLGYTRRKQQVD